MTHTINPERSKLTITVDAAERAELRELPDGGDIHYDTTMHDFLEPLTCNSELEWIDASETGDLTDAPMLGIYAGQDRDDYSDTQDRESYKARVSERWAFMDYQVRSVLEDLRDKGEAIFRGGPL